MNALPIKNTRQSKEAVGRILQRHDLRPFGSANTVTWEEMESVRLKKIFFLLVNLKKISC